MKILARWFKPKDGGTNLRPSFYFPSGRVTQVKGCLLVLFVHIPLPLWWVVYNNLERLVIAPHLVFMFMMPINLKTTLRTFLTANGKEKKKNPKGNVKYCHPVFVLVLKSKEDV